ncbi:hypothetical protein BJV74DRAFT_581104 [Russula compacta]|nr:hypothetical protein BJV74DRAFT_581104 [Russula compacta]
MSLCARARRKLREILVPFVFLCPYLPPLLPTVGQWTINGPCRSFSVRMRIDFRPPPWVNQVFTAERSSPPYPHHDNGHTRDLVGKNMVMYVEEGFARGTRG